MCIAVLSTAHPDYRLILINNRDEYLNRPTARASFWAPPNTHVLGGRDLLRSAQGTWLGITLDGRLACLTNYREDNAEASRGKISRGEMVNSYLKPSASEVQDLDSFVKGVIQGDGARGSGGFSMICGRLDEGRFAVVSNRTERPEWVEGRGVTVGLSNVAFGDKSWPKVSEGERLMGEVIRDSVARGGGNEELVEELLGLLSVDTLPPRKEGQSWEAAVNELRKSIFIPVVGDAEEREEEQGKSSVADVKIEKVKSTEKGVSGAYATQRQTVILVDHDGNVTFMEKSLFDDDGPVPDNDRIRQFEFKISKHR